VPINVYVVDDSAIMRQTLQHLLAGDPEIVLQGSAPNPLIAAAALRKQRPDVLLLDIEMPGKDGLTFLREVMQEDPIPTVICSSIAETGSRAALDAMSAGAVAVVTKPKIGLRQFLEDSRRTLLQTLKTAARAKPRRPSAVKPLAATAVAAAAAPKDVAASPAAATRPVLIGSSTGGTQAIEAVLLALPADAPGIAIVQHMPERFTAMYAQRLDAACAMSVREARNGDRLQRGLVLVAPGGMHMRLRKAGSDYFVVVEDGPPVNRHKPAVDVLFRSAAECSGGDALAIILTGMGDDGARGMKQLHQAGVRTIAQDEESCVVFGMPKEAIALGAVDEVRSLDTIAAAILDFDRRAEG
jgi:two-component system chemotaxis response regulator CheB